MARTTRQTNRSGRPPREAAGQPADRQTDDLPSIAEIAALTSRLSHLCSSAATDAERAAFLADKAALLARCPTPPPDRKD